MSTLSLKELTVETLLDEVRKHPSFRPEINSLWEAVLTLKGFAPFTYMIRKGEDYLDFYVSFVTDEHTVCSQKFIIDPDKLQYQYWNGIGHDKMISDDPYVMKYFTDLEDIIFLAAMKCQKHEAETVV